MARRSGTPAQHCTKPEGARAWHRFPRCPITGKVRLGERKDARLAVRECRRQAAAATVLGLTPGRRECRAYRCVHCGGWHLTSQAARPLRQADLASPPRWRDGGLRDCQSGPSATGLKG